MDPMVLATRKGLRSILEEHHVSGVANDRDTTVVLCLNCHAKVSNAQRDAGVFESYGSPLYLEQLISALRSEGTFLEAFAKSRFENADRIAKLVARLDETYPQWRYEGFENDV
jgi:hypothetical protein